MARKKFSRFFLALKIAVCFMEHCRTCLRQVKGLTFGALVRHAIAKAKRGLVSRHAIAKAKRVRFDRS